MKEAPTSWYNFLEFDFLSISVYIGCEDEVGVSLWGTLHNNLGGE